MWWPAGGIDLDWSALQRAVLAAMDEGWVAPLTMREGGLAVALAEMCLAARWIERQGLRSVGGWTLRSS